MTKQEEIGGKQDKILNLIKAWAVIPHPYESKDAEGLLYVLSKEEGVVIKVDRELPECNPLDIDRRMGMEDMLKAGYGAFESLI